MNAIKISVVTVCYNAVESIEETILSVLNQTYHNIEYIVIDGSSTDGTVEIIKKYADRLAYWVSEPDKGIYDAMNKGIAAATGDYINFMNAGDKFYANNSIVDVVDIISTDDKKIYYGDTWYKTEYKNFIYDTVDYSDLTYRMPFCHQSVFIETNLHKKHLFDISYRSSGDYELFWRLYHNGVTFRYIPVIVSIFDATDGISKDNYRLVMRENARIWGINKKIGWKCKYFISIAYIELRKIIKKSLPKKVRLKISSYRLKKYQKDVI